jgi:hypothetical protein
LISFVGYPGRAGILPEITKIELRKNEIQIGGPVPLPYLAVIN